MLITFLQEVIIVKSSRLQYLETQWLQSHVPNNFETSQKYHTLYNPAKHIDKNL